MPVRRTMIIAGEIGRNRAGCGLCVPVAARIFHLRSLGSLYNGCAPSAAAISYRRGDPRSEGSTLGLQTLAAIELRPQ